MSRKKIFLTVLLIAVWTVFMAWLVRYEAFPAYFTRSLGGYKEFFSGDILMSDTWMKIIFNGTPIGYSHSSIEENDTDPLFHYVARNEMSIRLNLMGENHDLEVQTAVVLDLMYSMQKFTFTIASKPADSAIKKTNVMSINAIRRSGNVFAAAMVTPNNTQRMLVEIPPDVIIYSPMTEIAMKSLRPGQDLTIKTFDPSTLSTAFVTIRAIRKEEISVNNRTYDATLLSTEYHGTSISVWIDKDGTVLKQETPFGWTMELCSPEEALNASLSGSSEDILKSMSVPCEGRIDNPRTTKSLRLKLKGVLFNRSELVSPRQKMESISGDEAIITVIASSAPGKDGSQSTDEDMTPFLRATPFLQADNSEISKRADEITKGKTTAMEKALAIYDWVHKNVEKEMTVSMPSALDVLRTMKGDCNEHTYLFVALARSAGIPATIKVGLAYHEEAFYYHAWPAVFTGEWVEMDPTWGQEYVDATHIAFAEGELADQVQIIKLLGQLRIEVLDAQ